MSRVALPPSCARSQFRAFSQVCSAVGLTLRLGDCAPPPLRERDRLPAEVEDVSKCSSGRFLRVGLDGDRCQHRPRKDLKDLAAHHSRLPAAPHDAPQMGTAATVGAIPVERQGCTRGTRDRSRGDADIWRLEDRQMLLEVRPVGLPSHLVNEVQRAVDRGTDDGDAAGK
jgi:hypothetical protein